MPSIKDYASILTGGMVKQLAPQMIQGALVEMLKNVSVEKASKWVEDNIRLWDTFNPKLQGQLKYLAKKAGPLDWLTADWAIQAITKDCPTLASLFLGWRKGHNWFVRQVEIIQGEITP